MANLSESGTGGGEMDWRNIPDKHLGLVIHYIMSFHNETEDFTVPHLRKTLASIYPLYIVIYGVVMLAGTFVNVAMIRSIIQQKKFRESMYKYLASNAFNDLAKCIFLLPISLSIVLIQNWMFGVFLCYFFPMVQDIAFHATLMTFLLVAFDRYRVVLYPLKPPLPSAFCLLGVWITSVVSVLPYSAYTTYIDLEAYFGDQFKGIGICAVNIHDNIEEYIRGLFIAMYGLPLALIVYLHVKATGEIKSKLGTFSLPLHSTCPRGSGMEELVAAEHQEHMNNSEKLYSSMKRQASASLKAGEGVRTRSGSDARPSVTDTLSRDYPASEREMNEDSIDWCSEKRTQNSLIAMVSVFAACLLPLNLLRLSKHVVVETLENSPHFDITFITFVAVAFIPTITTPMIFKSWQEKNSVTELCRYLQLHRRSSTAWGDSESPGLNNTAFDTALNHHQPQEDERMTRVAIVKP